MRRLACAIAVVGCRFNPGAPLDASGTVDSPPVFDDAGHEIRTWSFDTAQDFARATSLIDVGIDPMGSLTPAGYVYGGFVICGLDGNALWNETQTTVAFDPALAATPTGCGKWSGADIDASLVSNPTQYYGVSNLTNFSAWVLGEVYLTQGMHPFKLSAGDVAFLEIANPHAADWTQIAHSTSAGTVTATFMAKADGWYPIRIGWANSSNGYSLHFTDNGNHFARNQMRGRAEAPRGLLQTAFDRQLQLVNVSGANAMPRATVLAMDMLGPTTLPGVDGSPGPANGWSARWAGQFYVMTPGLLAVEVDSVDGNQVTLDGSGSGSNYSAGASAASTSVAQVTNAIQGWNDLVIDYNHAPGDVQGMQVVVTAAAETGLVNKALPAARLRPVEPPGDRLMVATNGSDITIPDNSNTGATHTIHVDGFANETITSARLRVVLTNPELNGLSFTLTAPGGTAFQRTSATTGSGMHTFFFDIAPSGSIPTTGNWTLKVVDTVNTTPSSNGTLSETDLTLHTSGGPDPIAKNPIWTSELIDNETSVASIESITWQAHSWMQNDVIVRLRACDAPCKQSDPWTQVQNSAPPPQSLAGHRYLQAQVEMTSDGIRAPELTSFVVVYKRNLN